MCNIINDEFVYHYSLLNNFNNWTDEYFRGQKWTSSEKYPHKLMKELSSNLKEGEDIFIMCFYTTGEIAERSKSRDFSEEEVYLLRTKKETIINTGFNKSFDDGFNNEEVYLFWMIDKCWSGNANKSSSGISDKHFEIQIDSEWKNLSKYRSSGLNSGSLIAAEFAGSNSYNNRNYPFKDLAKKLLNRLFSISK
jgi:hypothetical protein